MDQTDTAGTKRPPILTIVAAATLALSLLTPRFLLTIPIMAAVGLAIVAAFRKETPKPFPFVVGALSVGLLVVANSGALAGLATSKPSSNAALYKDATWQYGSARDDMRGTVMKWATLDSPTDLNFEAPYDGENAAHMEVGAIGSIILTVSRGQFLCNSGDTVAVKFDDGPIYNYPCQMPNNGDTTTLYIDHSFSQDSRNSGQPADPMDGLVKAKMMTVEAEFFDSGSRQITFHVAGLDRSKL